MLAFINYFNLIIFLLFTVFYLYQAFYVLMALFFKNEDMVSKEFHKYAVVVAARNESAVIKHLIESIKRQKYPASKIDIFVIADNCTDNTAQIAKESGAIVYERNNKQLVGKGYALDYIFKIIQKTYSYEKYEGYFIFDADNLLDENYIAEMNNVFDNGYKIVTSYRNSKNYDTNWITAGYSLWFLREAKFLNNPRMMLKTSCAVSGTGFLIHDDIIRKNNGWKHHLLTEDIEFSVDNVIEGEIIGYCEKAKIYDEQPYLFEQSWNQRLRWAKGFYQVFAKYGKTLVKNIFLKRSFSCYDMLMTITPAMVVTIASVVVNFVFFIIGMIYIDTMPMIIPETTGAMMMSFVNFYIIIYVLGLLTTISEWDQINCSSYKKILYTFTFPIFIFTYIPISIVALMKKIEWKPITHSIVKSIEEVQQ